MICIFVPILLSVHATRSMHIQHIIDFKRVHHSLTNSEIRTTSTHQYIWYQHRLKKEKAGDLISFINAKIMPKVTGKTTRKNIGLIFFVGE